jgi:putative transposase
MPRHARLVVENIPLHIIQRGNNRNSCFFSDFDFMFYLDILQSSAEECDCQVHAYVLMTNHVHLLVSPGNVTAPAKLMKILGERYVQYVNKRYKRAGTLWQGRYRSCLVGEEDYFLVCQRYIELNPVRAGMVAHPVDYRWSSHRSNAYGARNGVVSQHALYAALGCDDQQRQQAYRALFSKDIDEQTVADLRKATNSNFAFGGAAFEKDMEERLGRPVMERKPGRPRREKRAT